MANINNIKMEVNEFTIKTCEKNLHVINYQDLKDDDRTGYLGYVYCHDSVEEFFNYDVVDVDLNTTEISYWDIQRMIYQLKVDILKVPVTVRNYPNPCVGIFIPTGDVSTPVRGLIVDGTNLDDIKDTLDYLQSKSYINKSDEFCNEYIDIINKMEEKYRKHGID